MHCEGCIAPVPTGKDRWKGYVCRGVLRLGLGLHRLPRIHLPGTSVNKGKKNKDRGYEPRPEKQLAPALPWRRNHP